MSIFESIKNAIFRHADAPAATPSATQAPARPTAPAQSSASTQAPAPAATPRPAPAPAAPIDIESTLDALAKKNPQKLNWRTSIVDLMKLVDLDSSLEHRKQLAKELGYTGDTGDSAAMNVWLHKEVMKKLAANGGKVPASLQ